VVIGVFLSAKMECGCGEYYSGEGLQKREAIKPRR